ncbi:MAG: LETM1 domain-containing protein [Anaeromyxobacter sp.]
MKDTTDKLWLRTLVDEELARHDPDAVRARLPAGLQARERPTDLPPATRLLVTRSLRSRRLGPAAADPAAAFQAAVRGHVGLLLELAVVRGEPFVPAQQRAEIAAFLAAALGEHALAVEVAPEVPGGDSDRAVERAMAAAGEALRARFFPPGDPVHGLPLYPGAVTVLRRRLARVALGHARQGRLDPVALERHGAYAETELSLLAEAVAGLLAAAGEPDDRGPTVRARQLSRLGLSRAALRETRRRVVEPRPPDALAAAAPERIRPFLHEQLLLAQLRAHLPAARALPVIEAFVAAAGLDPATVLASQVEAAAQSGDHQAWFEAIDEGAELDWQRLADHWETVSDTVVERVSSAVTENLDALVTEIRETGELGQLLARAAAGQTLTAEERGKVRAQLVDLAKAVPALALFAAPGGTILLPVLAKLLPFNFLPSAWDRGAKKEARVQRGAKEQKGAEEQKDSSEARSSAGEAAPNVAADAKSPPTKN